VISSGPWTLKPAGEKVLTYQAVRKAGAGTLLNNLNLFFDYQYQPQRQTGVRVKRKIKALELKLQKMLEISEKLRTTKEESKSKSIMGDVIRRRKGEPDKWISLKLKKQ